MRFLYTYFLLPPATPAPHRPRSRAPAGLTAASESRSEPERKISLLRTPRCGRSEPLLSPSGGLSLPNPVPRGPGSGANGKRPPDSQGCSHGYQSAQRGQTTLRFLGGDTDTMKVADEGRREREYQRQVKTRSGKSLGSQDNTGSSYPERSTGAPHCTSEAPPHPPKTPLPPQPCTSGSKRSGRGGTVTASTDGAGHLETGEWRRLQERRREEGDGACRE